MTAVLTQVFHLLVFFLFSFLLCRKKLVSCEHAKLLSTLVIYVFLPSTILRNFVLYFNIENLTHYFTSIVVASGIVAFNLLISRPLAKPFVKEPYDENVYRYSIMVQNGNIGYGFAESMLPAADMLNYTIFTIPLNFYCYTAGYALLTKRKLSLKGLLNPVTVAMAVGAVLGLLAVPIPNTVQTLLQKSAACMVPTCMLVIGVIVSQFRIGELLKSKRALILSLIRLLALPLLLRFVLPLTGIDASIVRIAVLYYAMPCGMNTILFAQMIGEDCRSGAELVLLSHLLSILTIPLVTLGL